MKKFSSHEEAHEEALIISKLNAKGELYVKKKLKAIRTFVRATECYEKQLG